MQAAQPEVEQPEAAQPEVEQPEVEQAEVAQLEVGEHEAVEAGEAAGEHEAGEHEAAEYEVGEHEAAEYDDSDSGGDDSASDDEFAEACTFSAIAEGGSFSKMSLVQLLAAFDAMYNVLVNDSPSSPIEYGRFSLRWLFRDDESRIREASLSDLRKAYEMHAKQVNEIVYWVDKHGGAPDMASFKRKVAHYQVFMGQMYSVACASCGCVIRRKRESGAIEGDVGVKYPYLNAGHDGDAMKLKPGSQLLYFFLHKAFMNNLRKENGVVYEQKFVRGIPSHAWMPLYPIRTFIHNMAPKEIHYDIWEMVHGEGGSRVHTLDTYLSECTDSEFPFIKRDRRYMSFLNGVYDIYEDRFFTYDDPELTSDIVSCNLHLLEMRPEWWTEPYLSNPLLIPTPNLDHILQEQNFELGSDVYRWILAWVMGRPQFNMGVIEKHHRNGVLLLGQGGSGKSTMAKVVEAYYSPDDTGHLNSECEPKYALAALVGKYVWFCLEVKKNFQLDMGMLLQMLEGRTRISIQKKHETAWTEEWVMPGLMAANEIPSRWIDGGAGNSLLRRMFIVEFLVKPKKLDPMLETRLRHELPAIMVKSNRLYRKIAESIGEDGDIDSHMPSYFTDALLRFQEKTQPFVYMLNNHPDFVFDPRLHISLSELKTAFVQWAKSLGYKQSSILDDDEIIRQIKNTGLEVRMGQEAAGGGAKKRRATAKVSTSSCQIIGYGYKAELAQKGAGEGAGGVGGVGAGGGAGAAGAAGDARSAMDEDFFV
jgi:energy-coupling factor transporter ATP-binding protein EcfA2